MGVSLWRWRAGFGDFAFLFFCRFGADGGTIPTPFFFPPCLKLLNEDTTKDIGGGSGVSLFSTREILGFCETDFCTVLHVALFLACIVLVVYLFIIPFSTAVVWEFQDCSRYLT